MTDATPPHPATQEFLPSYGHIVVPKSRIRTWLPALVTGAVALSVVAIWAGPAGQAVNSITGAQAGAISNSVFQGATSVGPVAPAAGAATEPPSQRAVSGVQNAMADAGSTITVKPTFAALPPEIALKGGTLAIAPPQSPAPGHTYLTNADGSITALREARVIAVFSVEKDTVKVVAAGGTAGSMVQIATNMLDSANGLSTGEIMLTIR